MNMTANGKTTAFESEVGEFSAAANQKADVFGPQSVLALRKHPHEWLNGVVTNLERLATLEENWDSYGAAPVSFDSIKMAKKFVITLAMVENVREPAVGASPDGNVGFSWDEGAWSLDVEVLPNGRIEYVYLDERDSANDRETSTTAPDDIAELLTQWS